MGYITGEDIDHRICRMADYAEQANSAFEAGEEIVPKTGVCTAINDTEYGGVICEALVQLSTDGWAETEQGSCPRM